jgi:hypothetical protein
MKNHLSSTDPEPAMAAESNPRIIRVVTSVRQAHPENRLIVSSNSLVFDEGAG